MKTGYKILTAILFILLIGLAKSNAQEYKRTGNVIERVYKSRTKKASQAKDTGLKLKEKDGTILTVWQSKRGKFFVWKTSKKTGKKYRKYIVF